MTSIISLSTSIPAPLVSSIELDALGSAVVALNNALNLISPDHFEDAHVKHAEEQLKECLRIAGEDPAKKMRIKEVVDAYSARCLDNTFLKQLIILDYSAFSLLLIDLDVNDIYVSDNRKNPVPRAVLNNNLEVLSQLLKKLEKKDAYRDALQLGLNFAAGAGLKECVKMLLNAGADPNKRRAGDERTPFERAVNNNHLNIMALFFLFSRVDTAEAYKGIKVSTDFLHPCIEKTRLVTDISCFAENVPGRDKAIKHFLRPLMLPPIAVSELIDPIKKFIAKESQKDPHFEINIKEGAPDRNSARTEGAYSLSTGNINLYFPNRTNLDGLDENHPKTTLLHEACHKVIDKLGWKNTDLEREYSLAAKQDLHELNRNRWQCVDSVEERLKDVSRIYASKDVAEECLVRMPEIIFGVANRLVKDIEKADFIFKLIETRLNSEIPHLYKFYKEKFLPALRTYNSTTT